MFLWGNRVHTMFTFCGGILCFLLSVRMMAKLLHLSSIIVCLALDSVFGSCSGMYNKLHSSVREYSWLHTLQEYLEPYGVYVHVYTCFLCSHVVSSDFLHAIAWLVVWCTFVCIWTAWAKQCFKHGKPEHTCKFLYSKNSIAWHCRESGT